jgi:hypothetical protein
MNRLISGFLDTSQARSLFLEAAWQHVHEGRDEFVSSANADQMRQFENLVTPIRRASEQLEREFNGLE